MILLCGSVEDPVTSFFQRRLATFGVSHQWLDLSRYPIGHLVTQCRIGSRRFGSIAWAGGAIQTGELTGVFIRNFSQWQDAQIAGADAGLAVAWQAEKDLGLDSIWLSLDCVVVNRFGSSWSNHSKPFQTLALRESLFAIPKTLISNDAEQIRRFYEQAQGRVIYKSASSRSFGTLPVSLQDLGSLLVAGDAPIQLQERVPGADIRVHVVRDRVFATRVHCDAIDYRQVEEGGVRLEAIDLPAAVEAECIRIAQKFGLLFSGIDLRETPDGNYYCFEVNTTPDFAFYETNTGQEISAALADLLCGG